MYNLFGEGKEEGN